jgi:hypothetical protein
MSICKFGGMEVGNRSMSGSHEASILGPTGCPHKNEDRQYTFQGLGHVPFSQPPILKFYNQWCRANVGPSKGSACRVPVNARNFTRRIGELQETRRDRGFLGHILMTYSTVTPYLKGLHLTLASHHPGHEKFGWKMASKECPPLPT